MTYDEMTLDELSNYTAPMARPNYAITVLMVREAVKNAILDFAEAMDEAGEVIADEAILDGLDDSFDSVYFYAFKKGRAYERALIEAAP